jgi:hypothetical protein
MHDGMDRFRRDLDGLDQFQRAYEKMETCLSCEIIDCATLFSATLEIDARIDKIARRFPGNRMVERMAVEMKALHRREMLGQVDGGAGTDQPDRFSLVA